MSKHTPGPWRIIQTKSDSGLLINSNYNEADGTKRIVADCDMPHYDSFEMSIANANLIAAAPELLAAAKMAWAYWERAGLSFLGGSERGIHKDLAAAIKKAEGQS